MMHVDHVPQLQNRYQDIQRQRALAVEDELKGLLANPALSLREVVQEFLNTDAALDPSRLELQKIVGAWVDKRLEQGVRDPRIHELAELFERWREEGGSLGVWAYAEEVKPEAAEPLPTVEDVKVYLDATKNTRTTISAEKQQEVKEVIRGIVAVAKTREEALHAFEEQPRLYTVPPAILAREYANFLLASQKTEQYLVDVWKALSRRAAKDISLEESRQDRKIREQESVHPETTYKMKKNHLSFLLNPSPEEYLQGNLFIDDIREFLNNQYVRTNKLQLNDVLDEFERQYRKEAIEAHEEPAKLRSINMRLEALERIRVEALKVYARPSEPEIQAGAQA